MAKPLRVLVFGDNLELMLHFYALSKLHDTHTAFTFWCSNLKALKKQGDIPFPVAEKSVAEETDYIINTFRLVFSMHGKQIFPQRLVNTVRCINLHPGFNPYNRGWYPQVFSILNGQKLGATLHIMDEEIDHGPIIAQHEVNVEAHDTSLTAYRRVVQAEKELLSTNFVSLISGNYTSFQPLEGNYNSKADFNTLCALDLNSTATLKEHIDLLRALSHPPFKNAWFLDEQGKKITISLTLELKDNAKG